MLRQKHRGRPAIDLVVWILAGPHHAAGEPEEKEIRVGIILMGVILHGLQVKYHSEHDDCENDTCDLE